MKVLFETIDIFDIEPEPYTVDYHVLGYRTQVIYQTIEVDTLSGDILDKMYYEACFKWNGRKTIWSKEDGWDIDQKRVLKAFNRIKESLK
ncbi:MAG: hypothetical protein WC783_00275 [Candidatus Paceibacterota bacterium]|jgi:hypothetical protein